GEKAGCASDRVGRSRSSSPNPLAGTPSDRARRRCTPISSLAKRLPSRGAKPRQRYIGTIGRLSTASCTRRSSRRTLLTSPPKPTSARIGRHTAVIEDETLRFTPTEPGDLPVELEYRTSSGNREWREIGTLNVQPSAFVDLPVTADIEAGLALTVREVD